IYECSTCTPAIKVKADGSDQPVKGIPYYDTVAINVVNDHEVDEIDKKGGKVVSTGKTIISADGSTAIYTFTDSSDTNGGPPVTGKGNATRVAKGPGGSHAMSGSWRMAKMESLSDNGTVWTYKVAGNQLTMTNPTGQSFVAKLDGTEAPMKGDPGITSVSVRSVNANTLEETDKRNGKVIAVITTMLNADGKSAKIHYDDKLAGRASDFVAKKQ